MSIVWHAVGYFVAAAFLGIACFFLIGAAVTTVVPKSETALPIAFGTLLPLAFISDVFFYVSSPPTWLHDLASAFPVAPVARAIEVSFRPGHAVLADVALRAAGGARLERGSDRSHRAGIPLGARLRAGGSRAEPPTSPARALAGRTVTNGAK